ncbi:hypothetical protein AWB70_03813 [Caballeronia cordobensis]|uniref:Uncharacterized protein n=1 Tax=Caballeronia cordobensis TaxID=1353886 RepID=A0A158HUR7_CABCO|nr:hypothetical protein [Caballeronia cordobensis]SAL47887.1 hypothetical protein AWB70_03813 [Caballeronia cordobensis]
MKKNAKQIERAEGLRAVIRSTGTISPSQASLDLTDSMHERRLRPIEVRAASAFASIPI